MRNLVYLLTFFVITPLSLATSIFALKLLSPKEITPALAEYHRIEAPSYGSSVYAAIPDPVGKVAGVATVADARVEIIRLYLEKYNSPLVEHAHQIVQISEKHNLDFRLLVAIAQQESNLCKKIPPNTFNCWGWGIHSRGTLGFDSYEEAMEAVAQGLREDYLNKGYITPDEIMRKYTPSSPGTWAKGVNQFLGEME